MICIATVVSQLIFRNARNLHQLGLKDECRARRDGPHSSISVGELWRDGQLSLLAHTHVEKAKLPAVG